MLSSVTPTSFSNPSVSRALGQLLLRKGYLLGASSTAEATTQHLLFSKGDEELTCFF